MDDRARATRKERDSLGEVEVPADALYGAQTERARVNFDLSPLRFDRRFLHALGLIKLAAAGVNKELALLDEATAEAVQQAAREVVEGRHDDAFVVDVFQTGSGTSTNMNANEVIANRANQLLGAPLGANSPVHPNDHVNLGQSSNDVIPSAIHVAAALAIVEELLPALDQLADAIDLQAAANADVVTTGRTHLMDAMPVTMGQEMGAWSSQVRLARVRLADSLEELGHLAMGGTAVGTGVNAPAGFGKAVAARLAALTGFPFQEAGDHFAAQAALDTAVATSGLLKAAAVALMKIANDLRLMNSGPEAGLGEIVLPALQPGSSIMPGKINPVIPEAVAMAAAQVMGNDLTIAIAGQAGSFQLAAMLPLVAYDLLQSIALLAAAARALAERAVAGLTVNRRRIEERLARNVVLVTALVPSVGYDLAARIGRRATAEGRPLREVAREMTELSDERLDELLDPRRMV